MPALSSASASPRVLQLGPLYNNHLRRWSAHAAALGCHVLAAGHVRADRKPVDLAGIADRVEVAPDHISVADHDMQARWLDGVIDGLEPDLIQAHWLPRWGYLAARCGHPRVAVTAWGSDIYLAAGAERSRADEALLGARHLIARSAHMRRAMLARGARTDHIWRVDLGVDLERFRPAGSEEQRQIRARLRLPDGPVLLSLRAPTDLYNLDVVIEAFTRVRACWPESTLVLITGDAPFSERTKAALADTPGVRVIGQMPHADMPDYLRSATVGISIPASDGSPSSVWEGLAAGLPMVVSDLPQIAERVADSEAVELVAPSADAVAIALTGLLEDDKRRHHSARAARAWAVTNADERTQIARLGTLYRAMLTTPTPGRPPEPAQGSRSGRDTATATARARRPS